MLKEQKGMRRWREAAWTAALNGLAEHLGSLDKVTQVARLGVRVATSGDGRDLPKIADAASRASFCSEVHILDAGHFALDTVANQIAALAQRFVGSPRQGFAARRAG
jgi:hypothetical protein